MKNDVTGDRVLILFPHMVMPGGALQYALKLAEELQASGSTVGIVTLRADLSRFSPPSGVELISLHGPLTSSLWYWLFLPYWQHRLNRAIQKWHADIVVPQVFPANWWGWLYKRKHPGTKLVWICQEPSAFIHSSAWINALTPWWKSMVARFLQPVLSRLDIRFARQCDAAIANSAFTADNLEQIYGFPAAGIATPGLDALEFTDCHWPRKPEIITVARLTKFKRIDFLLEVFRGLLRDYPQLRYNIVGSGEEEGSLREKAIQLGIQSSVQFHGAVDNHALASLYHRSSLFLHGARNEPFGLAPLEAIASGTPVVAHQSGGIREFVDDRCGRLIDSTDPAVWSKRCAEYLKDISSNKDYYEGVQKCARNFGWSDTLKPALEIIADIGKYGRVLNPKPGRAQSLR